MKTKLFVAMVVLGAASFGAGCDDTDNTGGAGGTTSSSTSTKASTTGSMTTTTTTTTGANMTSTSSGAATCPITGTTDTCQHACEALYDCAAVADCNGKDLCAGVMNDPMQKTGFIGTDTGACTGTPAMMCKLNADCPMVNGMPDTCSGACLVTCNNQMALKSLVDPMDCESTVTTISSIPGGFKAFCTGMP